MTYTIMSADRQFVCLLLLLQIHLQMSFLLIESGVITRDHDYDLYYVKETITLHCHKESGFIGRVDFIIENTVVAQEHVTRINETYARMNREIRETDHAKSQYQCVDESADHLIGITDYIYSDYRPRNATNLKVLWLNKTAVNITWDFGPVRYKNVHTSKLKNDNTGEVIDFTTTWRTNLDDELDWKACTEENNVTCNITSLTANSDPTLFVRVNVTNVKRDDSVVHTFPGVPLNEYAKPLPIQVTAMSVNSTTAELTMTTPLTVLNYTITYHATWENQQDAGKIVTGLTEAKTWVIPRLHPAFTYRFVVRARFEQGFMSDVPSNIPSLQMPEDAPASAPIVPPASYYLDESKCSQTDSVATAYVYFQDIPENDQNGVIRNYTGEMKALSINDSLGLKQGRTLTFDHVPCRRDLKVTVVGSTDRGVSPPAVITLSPRRSDISSIVENLKLKIRVDGEVRAEWIPPPSPVGLSLFLYYCHVNSLNHNLCQDAIQYVRVDPSIGQHLLKSAKPVMKFGAAVQLAEGLTSGIKFIDCLYDPTRSAGQPPKSLRALEYMDHVELRWEGRKCNTEGRVITLNYIVEVCRSSRPFDCHNYSVDADSLSYRLKEVDQDTEYQVRILANTTSFPDSLTLFSDPVQVTLLTRPAVLPAVAEALITVGTIVLVLGLGLLLCCIFRNKFSETNRKFRMSVIPDILQITRVEKVNSRPDSMLSNGTVNQAFTNTSVDSKNTGEKSTESERVNSHDSGYPVSPPISPTSVDVCTASANQSTPDSCTVLTSVPETSHAVDGNTPLSTGTLTADALVSIMSDQSYVDASTVMCVISQTFPAITDRPAVLSQELPGTVLRAKNDDKDAGCVSDGHKVDQASPVFQLPVQKGGYVTCSVGKECVPTTQQDTEKNSKQGYQHLVAGGASYDAHSFSSLKTGDSDVVVNNNPSVPPCSDSHDMDVNNTSFSDCSGDMDVSNTSFSDCSGDIVVNNPSFPGCSEAVVISSPRVLDRLDETGVNSSDFPERSEDMAVNKPSFHDTVAVEMVPDLQPLNGPQKVQGSVSLAIVGSAHDEVNESEKDKSYRAAQTMKTDKCGYVHLPDLPLSLHAASDVREELTHRHQEGDLQRDPQQMQLTTGSSGYSHFSPCPQQQMELTTGSSGYSHFSPCPQQQMELTTGSSGDSHFSPCPQQQMELTTGSSGYSHFSPCPQQQMELTTGSSGYSHFSPCPQQQMQLTTGSSGDSHFSPCPQQQMQLTTASSGDSHFSPCPQQQMQLTTGSSGYSHFSPFPGNPQFSSVTEVAGGGPRETDVQRNPAPASRGYISHSLLPSHGSQNNCVSSQAPTLTNHMDGSQNNCVSSQAPTFTNHMDEFVNPVQHNVAVNNPTEQSVIGRDSGVSKTSQNANNPIEQSEIGKNGGVSKTSQNANNPTEVGSDSGVGKTFQIATRSRQDSGYCSLPAVVSFRPSWQDSEHDQHDVGSTSMFDKDSQLEVEY